MPVATPDTTSEVTAYLQSDSRTPHFAVGDSLRQLRELPENCIDCCMTSPPYWSQRKYDQEGIGLEATYEEYIDNLVGVFGEVKRVLKQTGSLWLNLGDTYQKKHLVGVPWRVAFALSDRLGLTLRNSVVWHKVKGGPDNATDKLRNVHENVFHFVKASKGYHYDIDAVRTKPGQAKVVNGSVVSATGVSGVRYRRQIELSTSLTTAEKGDALTALEAVLDEIRCGSLSDFRMIIRGQQRTTHSDSEQVSGRARQLKEEGYYFLKYHPKGSKPSDVWEVIPEDTQKRTSHFAPYPEDLCKIPILTTCPEGGVVLDPFCGTGTTMYVAFCLGRKSVGFDVSAEYIASARERCSLLL